MLRRIRLMAVLTALAVVAACTSGHGSAASGTVSASTISASTISPVSVAATTTSAASLHSSTTVPQPTPTTSSTTTPKLTVKPKPKPKPKPAVKPKPKPKPAVKPKPKPKPAALVRDPITGSAPVPNPVVAVKIDNTSAAFPQYGIASADIVYVEQVEGGLTRLIALFHSSLPTEVGPVRSVRSTDVDLLQAYQRPILVFSGGAGGPLGMLASSPIHNASGLAGYWRSSAKRAPYNLHANLKTIVSQLPGKGSAHFMGFLFAWNDPLSARSSKASHALVQMQAGRTEFRWDGRHYRLIRNGVAARDAQGNPIYADNVLVQRVVERPDGTVDSVGSLSYLSQTVGTGTFALLRDGHRVDGNWVRSGLSHPTWYQTYGGSLVHLRPGKTWVILAPQNATLAIS